MTTLTTPSCPHCHRHALRPKQDGYHCHVCKRTVPADAIIRHAAVKSGSGQIAGPKYHKEFHARGKP